MARTWKITVLAPRDAIEAALLAHEEADWDPAIALAGGEVAADRPDDWRLEAWLPRRPRAADRAALAALFAGGAPRLRVERLPARDWLALSQRGLAPIRAGRFHVRTPDYPAVTEPGTRDLVIPAGQAFGTGQHATTAGCLAMLTAMRARGLIARNLLDLGTGSGVLAFAALDLWPRAFATASDIDRVCADVAAENAAANRVPLGGRAGALAMTVADGLDHPLLAARGPYDLVIANILADPLIALMPDLARALVPGGSVLLAGLLAAQEPRVRRAARAAGLRLAARLAVGEWPVLWLRKRPAFRCVE